MLFSVIFLFVFIFIYNFSLHLFMYLIICFTNSKSIYFILIKLMHSIDMDQINKSRSYVGADISMLLCFKWASAAVPIFVIDFEIINFPKPILFSKLFFAAIDLYTYVVRQCFLYIVLFRPLSNLYLFGLFAFIVIVVIFLDILNDKIFQWFNQGLQRNPLEREYPIAIWFYVDFFFMSHSLATLFAAILLRWLI